MEEIRGFLGHAYQSCEGTLDTRYHTLWVPSSGHSSQRRRHASCSNCNWGSSCQHECRGPARELLWSDTAEGGGHCRVIYRGECCNRLSNVFLARGHFGLDICVCNRSSTIHRSSISAGRARRRTTVKGQTWWQFIQT